MFLIAVSLLMVFLHFKYTVGKRGLQVSVSHFLNTEAVDHLKIGCRLQALEFIDGDLSVINGDEVDELLEVLNIDVQLLD